MAIDSSELFISAYEKAGELDAISISELEARANAYDRNFECVDTTPDDEQLLGRRDVFFLIINRSIGSGKWTVTPKVLAGTGSIGGALFVWVSAGLIAICGAWCWVELGLTIPYYRIRVNDNGDIQEDGETVIVAAPRSGGEKNFLERICGHPRFLMTCMFGIMFIILGNISGNSVAFGIFVMIAAGKDPVGQDAQENRAYVNGIAIVLLTFCAALHMFTRRGGILLSNYMAAFKIALILVLALLGFVHAGGQYLQRASNAINEPASADSMMNTTSAAINSAAANNFGIHNSFASDTTDISSVFESFLYALFTYTGFRQPFYVLSEVRKPRELLPKIVPAAMATITFLYVLLNVAYFCVVPKEAYTNGSVNTIHMATLFLHYLFDETAGPDVARRIMAGLMCVSIFGNVIVMTFAAARVKQELAKEGILPFSLFFARGYTTPWSWLKQKVGAASVRRRHDAEYTIDLASHRERSPAEALLLHWLSSVILVAATAALMPKTAYALLLSLYSYVDHILLGALVSGGLLYLKLDAWRKQPRRRWSMIKDRYVPFVSPAHIIIYFVATTILVFTAFVPPADGSPFTSDIIGYPWYILPTIGCTSLLWEVIWWIGLRFTRWRRRVDFSVERTPCLDHDRKGNYVQIAEHIAHRYDIVADTDVVKDDDESRISMQLVSSAVRGRNKHASLLRTRPVHSERIFLED